MHVGIDTDFWICLSVKEHPRHDDAQNLWNQLGEREAKWVLLPQVITEFIHVITDARRFASPPSMEEALNITEKWLQLVELKTPPATTPQVFIEHMKTHQLGRKRVLDTFFASSLLDSGITHIATGNGKDYKIFPSLTIHEF